MAGQVVYYCAAASGTGTAGEPPSSGAKNVEAALPPGCVREAEWKSAQPPAYLKIFRQIIATPASAMPIRHFTVIFSLKNMRHIISDSISEPP